MMKYTYIPLLYDFCNATFYTLVNTTFFEFVESRFIMLNSFYTICVRDRGGHDGIVVGLTFTYAINIYHN